jgi:hypothetical protein
LTEEVARKVNQFIINSLAGFEIESNSCDFECKIVEQLQEFLFELQPGRIDAYFHKLKANAKKGGHLSAISKSSLRGILYSASDGALKDPRSADLGPTRPRGTQGTAPPSPPPRQTRSAHVGTCGCRSAALGTDVGTHPADNVPKPAQRRP